MKKALCLLLALIFSLVVFVGCQKEPQTPPCETQTPLSEFQFKHEYSISKLRAFFGEIPYEEKMEYTKNGKYIKMDEVNKKFPIEFLKVSLREHQYYAVYKVKEGGYYYIFWYDHIEDNGMNYTFDNSLEKCYLSNTHYLTPNCFCSASDLKSIVVGESTAEDVAKIDPEYEMIFVLSSGITSFSYLNDGSIFMVIYTHSPQFKSREDLTVSKWRHYTVEDLKGSMLTSIATIHPEDLP